MSESKRADLMRVCVGNFLAQIESQNLSKKIRDANSDLLEFFAYLKNRPVTKLDGLKAIIIDIEHEIAYLQAHLKEIKNIVELISEPDTMEFMRKAFLKQIETANTLSDTYFYILALYEKYLILQELRKQLLKVRHLKSAKTFCDRFLEQNHDPIQNSAFQICFSIIQHRLKRTRDKKSLYIETKNMSARSILNDELLYSDLSLAIELDIHDTKHDIEQAKRSIERLMQGKYKGDYIKAMRVIYNRLESVENNITSINIDINEFHQIAPDYAYFKKARDKLNKESEKLAQEFNNTRKKVRMYIEKYIDGFAEYYDRELGKIRNDILNKDIEFASFLDKIYEARNKDSIADLAKLPNQFQEYKNGIERKMRQIENLLHKKERINKILKKVFAKNELNTDLIADPKIIKDRLDTMQQITEAMHNFSAESSQIKELKDYLSQILNIAKITIKGENNAEIFKQETRNFLAQFSYIFIMLYSAKLSENLENEELLDSIFNIFRTFFEIFQQTHVKNINDDEYIKNKLSLLGAQINDILSRYK